MSFNTQIKWSVFLIAFYLLPNIAEPKKLPRDNLAVKSAVICLTTSIKTDLTDEWFRGKLTYGEILEEFCKDKDIFNVKERLEKYDQKKINEEVKQCLDEYKHPTLYDDYYKFGQDEFINSQSLISTTEEYVNNIRGNSDDDTISLNDLKEPLSKIIKRDEIQSSQTSQSLASKDQKHPDSKDEANKNDVSDFSKFVIGLCYKDESLNFNDLESDGDKKNTVQCLHDCAKEFFDKIVYTLNDGRAKIKENLKNMGVTKEIFKAEKKDQENFGDQIKFLQEDSKLEGLENSFEREFHKNAREEIQTITNDGKKYLKRYSEAYSIEVKYLVSQLRKEYQQPTATDQTKGDTQNDDDEDDADENDGKDKKYDFDTATFLAIDGRLSRSFIYYKRGCAKRQCFMKKNSLPLYDYINDEANRRKTITPTSGSAQQTVLPSIDDKSNNAKDTTTTAINEEDDYEQIFFKALLSADDDDDDSSDSEE